IHWQQVGRYQLRRSIVAGRSMGKHPLSCQFISCCVILADGGDQLQAAGTVLARTTVLSGSICWCGSQPKGKSRKKRGSGRESTKDGWSASCASDPGGFSCVRALPSTASLAETRPPSLRCGTRAWVV